MKESTSIILLMVLAVIIGQWLYINGTVSYGFPLGIGLTTAFIIGRFTN